MFLLLAGRRTVGADRELERMARLLAGGPRQARVWRDGGGCAAAASVAPDFVPEDAFDDQPIVTAGGVFVCHARIDNRSELLRRLGLPADAPLADSSLLARAYERWGEGCVDEAIGDFAFAAWHRADDRVVAAVDHIGARRLLWAWTADGVALSAQLRPLLAHPQVSAELDIGALAKLFDAGLDRRATPFESVRSLPGGHVLTWRAGAPPRVRCWWRPETQPTVWHSDPREYVDETRELLTQAVDAQLRSSGPVSSTLSGGLDSASVTATAARLLGARGESLTAYTSVPESGLEPSRRAGWEPDDSGYARAVAQEFGNVRHELMSPSGRCALDVLPPVHARSCTPTKSATNLLWLDRISASAAAGGSRVVLMGQNGNMLFSWRGQAQVWQLARLGRPRAALAQAQREARARDANLGRVLAGATRAGWRSSSSRKPRDAGRPARAAAFLTAERRRSLPPRDAVFAIPPWSHASWVALATMPRHVWSPDPVAQWGVEWRDPTADRRLVERLLQFPQAAFRIDGLDRGLARSVAQGLLPDRVRLRTTQGAQVPEAPSLIAANAARYRQALDDIRASKLCRGLVDSGALGRALERICRGERDYYLALAVDRGFDAGLFLSGLERG